MKETVVLEVLFTCKNELTVVTVHLGSQTFVVVVTPDLGPSLQILVAVSTVVMFQLVLVV